MADAEDFVEVACRQKGKMKTFLLKLDNEVHRNWSDEATARKMTLSEFIRSTVNAQLGRSRNGSKAVHDAGGTGALPAPKRRGGVPGGISVADTNAFEGLKRSEGRSIEHSPTCSCELCKSRKGKKVKN